MDVPGRKAPVRRRIEFRPDAKGLAAWIRVRWLRLPAIGLRSAAVLIAFQLQFLRVLPVLLFLRVSLYFLKLL